MKLFLASSLFLLTSTTAAASFTNPTSNYNRCLTDQESSSLAEALDNGESTIDLFPSKSYSDQSSYWDIEYHNVYKLLRNKEVNTTYLLYQCGLNEVPTIDEPVDGTFPVPFEGGLVVTETTQVPNIEIMNRRHQIVAFAVSENLISSPCLSQEIIPAGKEDGSITFLPLYNDSALESYMKEYQGQYDTILAFGGAWDENPRMENKIVISSVGESPMLAEEQGRDVNQAIFEWLEVYGALFNEERMASEVVEETKARYDCHTANAAAVAQERRALAAAEGREERTRPIVLWAYHMQDYNGDDIGWDVGECPNYYCTYAEHCQVELLNSTEGSVDYWGYAYMSDDEFLEFGKDADVWIYPSSNWNTLVSQKADYLSQFKSVANMEVYDYQMSGESAWFEQRLAEYDTVLLDFCETAERDIDPMHERKWFRNVYIEGVGNLGMCTDADASYESRATECVELTGEPSSTESSDLSGGSTIRSASWSLLMFCVGYLYVTSIVC